MSRSGTSGTFHSDNGRSHGKPRSPGFGVRSRNSVISRVASLLPSGARAWSVDALASVRMEQVDHAFGMPAQPHRVSQLGGRARVAPRHQFDAGAGMGVHVRLAAEVLDQVDDDLN